MNPFLKKCQQGWRKANWLNYLLLPVSGIYRLTIALRKRLYQVGLFSSSSLPVPIIVVGGISVGGTGKTPFVIILVKYLKDSGYHPGVISRGYGGNNKGRCQILNHNMTAEQTGDEPLLIFRKCAVPIAIGSNKVACAELLQQTGCDIIISDDGFQHFALKRDVDVLVIDGEYGLGNRFCLPSGPLREPLKNIKRANCVICNTRWIPTLPNDMPPYVMNMTLQHIQSFNNKKTQPIQLLQGKQVHAVAALGNPERFFKSLEAENIGVIRHPFPDHTRLTAMNLTFADNHPILITEKDAVKLTNLATYQQIIDKLWVVSAAATVPQAILSHIKNCID